AAALFVSSALGPSEPFDVLLCKQEVDWMVSNTSVGTLKRGPFHDVPLTLTIRGS
ncbi:hypothetical protein AVEN_175568-1, partial [Araneus ventricosus]